MALFLKFKFLIAFKLNFNGGQLYKKYKNIKFWLFRKMEISHNKIINFEVENFDHLRKPVLTSNSNKKMVFTCLVVS